MARLSERMGLVEPRSLIQVDELDVPTRTALWNSFFAVYGTLGDMGSFGESPQRSLLRQIWMDHLERPLDEFNTTLAKAAIKALYLHGSWIAVLEMVEYVADELPEAANIDFIAWVTSDFERYLVGFRFGGNELIPVSDPIEVSAIEAAMSGVGVGSGGRAHLQRATQLLSNRAKPQYAKVISESVSAVESVVAELTGEKVLSNGLRKLDRSAEGPHKALTAGWDKLYGYASDASGIRHGLVRDEDATEPLAVYFLVSCSAFMNYLLKIHENSAA